MILVKLKHYLQLDEYILFACEVDMIKIKHILANLRITLLLQLCKGKSVTSVSTTM